jgi:hypothetical protein
VWKSTNQCGIKNGIERGNFKNKRGIQRGIERGTQEIKRNQCGIRSGNQSGIKWIQQIKRSRVEIKRNTKWNFKVEIKKLQIN